MMLGLLLARAGRRIVVLEKHADFFRDFRGDTIHPSTITLLGELGLRDDFLALPLNRVTTMDVVVGGTRLTPVDFSTLPGPDNFLVFAPQWDFLSFLADVGERTPGFELRMSTAATDLLTAGQRAVGVVTDSGEQIRARLVVAADGRDSLVRALAGLVPQEFGVPVDVAWFNLPKPPDPPPPTLGYLDRGALVLTIERGDHYQGGLVIAKGGFEQLRAMGLPAFRETVVGTAPVLGPVVDTLLDWDQVKLLTVRVNRLPRWYRPGVLCIGDAAHAMSPVGGVGVNYAIQDAVATANLVAQRLADGAVPLETLRAVQRRREPPARRMQTIQLFAHRRFARPGIGPVLPDPLPPPARLAIGAVLPAVRWAAARFIGIGLRPEHLEPELIRPA
jgi:2-polyprenyl-6-methoxyphenol hydroxylase-like FAD-dependent oxidoreductase